MKQRCPMCEWERPYVGAIFRLPVLLSTQAIRVNHGNLTPRCACVLLLCVLSLISPLQAQNATEPDQQMSTAGEAMGPAHAAVKDAQERPITAGGFVDGAPVVFRDITREAGRIKFHHRSATSKKTTIIESPGSGGALLDYDNDGWLDIYLLNGSTVPALRGQEAPPRAMLFHNNHDGTFSDVTDKAGVANERWDFGVAVGDYDNDGWPDIYVANYGKNRLYHNNHDGTLTDVAEKAGVALGVGQPGQAREITTATVFWICSCRDT
jgi:hypothetical protein